MREGFLISRCERYSDLLVPLIQVTQYSLYYSSRSLIEQPTSMWFHDLSFEKMRKSLKNEYGQLCPNIVLTSFKTVILALFQTGDNSLFLTSFKRNSFLWYRRVIYPVKCSPKGIRSPFYRAKPIYLGWARCAQVDNTFFRVPFNHPFLRRLSLTRKWAG